MTRVGLDRWLQPGCFTRQGSFPKKELWERRVRAPKSRYRGDEGKGKGSGERAVKFSILISKDDFWCKLSVFCAVDLKLV